MPGDVFGQAEYERRIERTKERMHERKLDALVVTDPSNMNYLAGYDGWSFYVPQAVIVTHERDEPVWVGRGMDANGARATTWLEEENIHSYSDDHVHSPHDLHPMDYVAGLLEDLGIGDGKIGGEMDAYYFTAKSYQRLREKLPEATFEDTTLLVNWIRIYKSEQVWLRMPPKCCTRFSNFLDHTVIITPLRLLKAVLKKVLLYFRIEIENYYPGAE